jgi:hypothetical protein
LFPKKKYHLYGIFWWLMAFFFDGVNWMAHRLMRSFALPPNAHPRQLRLPRDAFSNYLNNYFANIDTFFFFCSFLQ